MQQSQKNCGMETQMNNSLKKNNYKIQDIIKILPHRYPFILIDRINEDDEVEFELKEGRKGMNAINVKVIQS